MAAALVAHADSHPGGRIYARSVFPTSDVPQPTQFYSILGIDCKKEAGLDPSRVHVVTGASKDYSINGASPGLRLGLSRPPGQPF